MRKKHFKHIDAFTLEPYRGNPAAVVFDADDLSEAEMQTIARQMNLSETVFLLRPNDPAADYRVRIFTPRAELPFAGHPTLAAAYTVLNAGLVEPRAASPGAAPRLIQECGIGLIPVVVELGAGEGEAGSDSRATAKLTMTQGAAEYHATAVDSELAARMLGCDVSDLDDAPAEVASTGAPWLIIPLRTLDAMQRLSPDQPLIERVCHEHRATGVTTFCPQASMPGCDYRLRSFAPGHGIAEDPVCGSGNGSVGAYIARHMRAAEAAFAYVAEQGLDVHRRGQIYVTVDRPGAPDSTTPRVQVGGHAVQVMEGTLRI